MNMIGRQNLFEYVLYNCVHVYLKRMHSTAYARSML